MTKTNNGQKKYKIPDYKADNIHNDWCPGCGDYGILSGIQMALANLGLPPHEVAVISGIGCSGKTSHYINAYGFHTLHGRVVPNATGMKLANHDLTVLGVGGDGDGYGIGAGHFVAGGRRNLDFTYVIFNNNIYALTKGQASPTIGKGEQTKTMPEQSIYNPINPVALAISSGYTFVAQSYALDVKYTADIIARAIQHPGSAVVDVLQTCPAFNNLHTKTWFEGLDREEKQPRLYKLEDEGYDGTVPEPENPDSVSKTKAAAIEKALASKNGRIPVGVFYEHRTATLEDYLSKKIPALASTSMVKMDIYDRDISPLLDELR
ncbi:MAG: 2-oxoacid:ferredoxin oxidoreductase subunit beta [Candidatus Marinimicrobia bacterium]|nr:2-oxoacid:ferredoxin oxidoreductase subunit beta [Candidatus Neomarinimicrobiota bacterium]MCF7829748.1 2-oxoacid:ferredoxin oxidoreductase subunit beta [Candidatus Neomarinimicrobiota bacterium]MCF7881698.1 2-oxoacid:ferredoxin oxidoreductase subunit beta [Candidatus Neomarinimicrobiota bacterium]